MADWQKVAAKRLVRIHQLERVYAQRAADAERIALDEIERVIHSGCLASLGDDGVRRLLAEAPTAIAERIARLP